jgi:hypothetical protein
MKRYQASVPHVVIGMAAMAMTTVTLAMAVVLPAASDCGYRTVAATKTTALAATEVAISPARIDVVATREATSPHAAI